MTEINWMFLGAFSLLGIGLYGLMVTRNLIKIVALLQIMVKGAMLALVAASGEQIHLGESLAVTVIVVDTLIAVAGLALAVQLYHQRGTLDITPPVRQE